MQFVFDNLYVLLILAGAIAQWLINQREERRRRQLEEMKPAPGEREEALPQDFEDTLRRQAEAESSGPIERDQPSAPPALPSPASPAPPLARSEPAPLPQAAGELERQEQLAELLQEAKAARLAPRQQAAGESVTYNAATAATPWGTRQPTSLRRAAAQATRQGVRSRLSSVGHLRETIVLREILDRPLAMRRP